MAFDGFHGSTVGRGITEVVKDVAARSDSGTPRFILFGSVIDGVTRVGDFLSGWYFVLMDPFEDVNAFNVTIALEEAGKFVDTGLVPSFGNGAVRMFDEITPGSKF